MRKNEREDKHKMSLAKQSKWPNTIHAERERKEYERIKKREDDEVSFKFLSVILFRSNGGKSMPKKKPSNRARGKLN